MKNIFPIEILENSAHLHWHKHRTKSRIIYFLIIILVIITFLCLPFIYIDITSQSPAIIRSPQENNILQSTIYAQVIKSNIDENMFVYKGDTLLWLKSNDISFQIQRIEQKLKENSLLLSDLNKLLIGESNKLQTDKYITENAHFKATINEQLIVIDQTKSKYETSNILFKKGVEAEYDFRQNKSNFESSTALLKSIQDQQYSMWQAEKTKLLFENEDLKSEILQLKDKSTNYIITAPITGNIIQYIGLRPGNFISPSQTIAYIISDEMLIAECYISPSDIGYVAIGQKVDFQMESFNYQQWGLLHGEVIEIISGIIQIENKPFFRVRCKLDSDYLTLKNGYKGYIKNGMSCTGRFFITKRSLVQLLFDKVDNWLNPKIISNGN